MTCPTQMDDITGFVCPLCFVAFISPEHLKRHFVEMHSDRSGSGNSRNGLETDEVPFCLFLNFCRNHRTSLVLIYYQC